MEQLLGIEIHGKLVLEVLVSMKITELIHLVGRCKEKMDEMEILIKKMGE